VWSKEMIQHINGFEFYPHEETPIMTEAMAVTAEHVAINDSVNHPIHYNQTKVEVIDLIEDMSFNRGNAVKYICRAGFKPDTDEVEDLEKAKWYLEREINRVKSSRSV
jgi:hypothetical protein